MHAQDDSHKVLLVDDSWYIQLLVQDLLGAEGYDVVCVRDGTEAVNAYGAEEPDVVLMDIILPDLDGFDACMRIRELDPDAQVVFMTGLLDDFTRIKASEVGATGFLPKPISADDLAKAVSLAAAKRDLLACGLQPPG